MDVAFPDHAHLQGGSTRTRENVSKNGVEIGTRPHLSLVKNSQKCPHIDPETQENRKGLESPPSLPALPSIPPSLGPADRTRWPPQVTMTLLTGDRPDNGWSTAVWYRPRTGSPSPTWHWWILPVPSETASSSVHCWTASSKAPWISRLDPLCRYA